MVISRYRSMVTTFRWDDRGATCCRLAGIGARAAVSTPSALSALYYIRACGGRENLFVSARHMIIYPWVHWRRGGDGGVQISLQPVVADYSCNGTFLNGRNIQKEHAQLRQGDRIDVFSEEYFEDSAPVCEAPRCVFKEIK